MSTHFTRLFAVVMLCLLPGITVAQNWSKKAALVTGKTGAVSFSANNKLYVGGGGAQLGLAEYDPATNTWNSKANIPGSGGRIYGITFTIQGKNYVGLGADYNSSTYYNDLWVYDAATDTWTKKTDLPGPGREGAGCFVVNDKVYIVGGADVSRYADVWEYDPAADAWTNKGTYPGGPLIYPFAFSIKDKGYISCGFAGADVSTLTYEYNAQSNTWTRKADFAGAKRQNGTAFVLNDIAYCGLGSTQSISTDFKDFYSYDPVANKWNAVGDLPAQGRFGASAAVVNNKAYVAGGFSDLAELWEFSLFPAGVNDMTLSDELVSYPVPTHNTLYIKVPGDNAWYSLTDMMGRQAQSGPVAGDAIDISQLAVGSYLLKVWSNSSSLYKNRIVVAH